MPSTRRGANRQKARARNHPVPRQRQPHAPATPQKRSPGATIWKATRTFGAAALSVAAIVISLLTYADQHAATEAQLQVDSAAANAALRQEASKVSYWLQGVPHKSSPELVIENSSDGPLRDMELMFPQPVQGCSRKCNWVADDWVTLTDLPPCSIETTTEFDAFSRPAIGAASLNGSHLNFTDKSGNTWALFGGSGKLIRLARYKPPAQLSWSPNVTFKPADDCS